MHLLRFLCSYSYPYCLHTWRENTLKAGIGIRAAAKNAQTLHREVNSTLRPVVLRTAGVLDEQPSLSPQGLSA